MDIPLFFSISPISHYLFLSTGKGTGIREEWKEWVTKKENQVGIKEQHDSKCNKVSALRVWLLYAPKTKKLHV